MTLPSPLLPPTMTVPVMGDRCQMRMASLATAPTIAKPAEDTRSGRADQEGRAPNPRVNIHSFLHPKQGPDEIGRLGGYRVLAASNGWAGLEVLARYPAIRLLFTDVGLPGGMTGRQLADQARQQRPDLLVLFTTGYARNAIVHGGILDAGTHLLPKPFTYAALAAKIRALLDG